MNRKYSHGDHFVDRVEQRLLTVRGVPVRTWWLASLKSDGSCRPKFLWQLRADHERSTQKEYVARPNNLVERAPRATPRPDPKSLSDHRKLAIVY